MFRYYTTPTSDLLADLVSEVVDADDDSARLAMDLVEAECWQTHACRPRDLQHAGREALTMLRDETKIGDRASARGVRRRRMSLGRLRSRPHTLPSRQAFERLPVRSAR
jgi:hypothetical protein